MLEGVLKRLGDGHSRAPERGVVAEQIVQPLLALPVEIVLLTHGAPAERTALEGALAS